MPIPEFEDHGFLPPGIHECTLEELAKRFGAFKDTDRRPTLWKRLAELADELRRSQLFVAVVIDGSFATAAPAPNDIDIILVLDRNHNSDVELPMSRYALVSRQSLHRRFGFDVLIARDGSLEYEEYCEFFSQVRGERSLRKGMVKIYL